MAISPEIAATISEMSKPKAEDRPFVVRTARPIGPTAERMDKPDYFGARGSRKKCRNLVMLRDCGDIDSEAESTAESWLHHYQFSQYGYSDFMYEPRGDDYIKGDVHTFAVSRGKSGEIVSLVREIIGDPSHDILVRMLFAEQSFNSMSRDLLPGGDGAAARKAIRQRAVQLLQMLPGAYRTAHKMRRASQALARN